jgi:dGTPase
MLRAVSTASLEEDAIRLLAERREHDWLDARAAKADQTRGRALAEEPDAVRTDWQRDRDRILHTKAFRRLKHKTQVFVSPGRDHYRTRLTHTLEVTQIARTVARALRLNEDLVEAIGVGHDLGHAPFGHVGEYALDDAYRQHDPAARFRHYEQSLRIVDELENEGKGLNLTWEVRDGILHHSKGKSDLNAGQSLDKWLAAGKPSTFEGQIIRICDRVAYVNHDIDDAIRAGLIAQSDLPRACLEVLGERHSQRITAMVHAIIVASSEVRASGERVVTERIAMTDEVMQATDALKDWMFDNVYKLDIVGQAPRARMVILALFDRFMEQPQLMQGEFASSCEGLSTPQLARCVCDYIAGMTDRFAAQTFADFFMPASWHGV